MKRLFALLMVALALGTGWTKEAMPLAEDPVVEQRMIAISEELRCLVCQNESLAVSRAELAQDLRREVRTLIRQGRSDDQIRDFLVARYGDYVLYRPRVKPETWLLWAGPFLLMIIGVAILLVYLRRRNRLIDETPLTKDEARRIDALLKEGEK
ncbi:MULTISPECIES: cytochrome c-type biogenesis protein [unclassified Variovorax]|uniref:cytochrome c-type biogenesis protein n=1 Tax=unclassified Variovorax TaxID=663243 RepID=UPI003ECEA6CE